MRGFATGVGSKADIGARPLTQLSFMRDTTQFIDSGLTRTRRWRRP